MINIPVDEAFAFDYLSILKVKCEHNVTCDIKKQEYSKFEDHLILFFGILMYNKIINSKEYLDLLEVNRVVFDLVDLAKEDKIKASAVDNANFKRFMAKRTLQHVFFGNNLTEEKIGYKNE